MQAFCAKVCRVVRWRVALLSVVFAAGCGETSKNSGDEPNGPSTSSSNSLTTTNTGGTTGSSTQAAASSTTHPVTGVSAGGASVASSTEGVSSTTQAGGSGGAAGGGSEPECSSDDDCRLFSDCCTCAAYPSTGEAPEACPADCDQVRCERYGIDQAQCFAGSCVVATTHQCSPLAVMCDSLPPECPGETLPSVGADQCWTGDCVPADLCGWRPDCSSCREGEVCFRGFNDAFGAPYHCMRRPVTCADQATCDCARQLCEGLGFHNCSDDDDGVMQCSP